MAISNAEPLFDYQRETISKAFNCSVRETYGMAEMAAAAGECENGNLHQWSDVGIIEKKTESANELTDFICTSFVNPDMPLIRYKIGDCGFFSNKSCACQRNLPIIEKIEGRTDDVLFTTDGRRIGRLDPIFKNDLPIIEAQIIQESRTKLTVKYVPDSGFDQKSAKELQNRIRERMGDVDISLERVSSIPRTLRGKFRAVICNLTSEEKK